MITRPLVSIIIPCWNCEDYISEAITSALSQTYDRIEVIVVDDGSSDRSRDIASLYPGISVIAQQNSGVSTARNAGLEKSHGHFVLFLDADDRLDPDAVKLHIDAFSASDDISLVYGTNRIIDSQGRVIDINSQDERFLNWRDILMGETPVPSQSMFKRDSIIKAGMFNPLVKLGEDFDLNLRLTFLSLGYCHGNVVVDYRRHNLQATRQTSGSLLSMLSTISRFKRSIDKIYHRDEIWKKSTHYWRVYFGQYIPFEIFNGLKRRQWRRAISATRCYVQHFPATLLGSIQYISRRAKLLLVR